jgi:hypothetical protein
VSLLTTEMTFTMYLQTAVKESAINNNQMS